jgi:hypothetical protein
MFVMITICGANGARAQPASPPANVVLTPGEWSVTPFAGFGFSGNLDGATGAVGVASGYNWSSTVSLEGEFNLLPSSELSGVIEADNKVWSLTGNLLYHFAPRPFRPYGVIGMGFGHSSLDRSSIAPGVNILDLSSTEFIVNFGGGAERSIRENVRFRGDLRYFFGSDHVPNYWRLSAGLRFAIGSR